jgi:Fe/S biogenesis protein NfuA
LTTETEPTESSTDGHPETVPAEAGPVLEITEAALAKILEIRAAEDDPHTLGLRVSVSGVRGIDYTYDLSFEDLDGAADDDDVTRVGELTVMVPADSVDRLRGAALDLPSTPGQAGLVIRNPNRPNPLGDVGDLELTGDIADKVRQLLDERINPALAAHGGFASLVGVDECKVFVTMGGGCQGCSMSAATLTEGIRASILEAIPEVTDVIDATDHTAGENPYY